MPDARETPAIDRQLAAQNTADPGTQPTPTEALTVAERNTLLARLQHAWKLLPADKQASLRPILDEGHAELASFVSKGAPPTHHTQMTLRLKSYLTNDYDSHLAALGQPLNLAANQPLAGPIHPAALQIGVAPDGSILGTGKYQQLDPRWELVAGTVWLEHLLLKHPFPPGAPDSPEPIPDNTSLALLSDWGTGNFGAGDAPAIKLAKLIPKLKPAPPAYTIHLGDVYYAGQSDEEQSNLLTLWPQGTSASFALNSNHEMYSGGGPYFNQAVGGPIFNKLQSPWSFFALETPHWLILGLDSAYFSDVLTLYLVGTLGQANTQTAFVQRMAQHAKATGKKTIILTHHNPIPIGGIPAVNPPAPLQLYTDVMNAFAGCPAPAFWYYGHEHIATAYAPLPGTGTRCRCLGHGGLPWGQSSDLAVAKSSGQVEWFENRLAGDPTDPLRVYNGFVLLTLSGPQLTETFYDETGQVAWSSTH